MTTRHAGYTIALAEPVREDDAINIITALKQIRGVIYVTPITENPSVTIGEARARNELTKKLWEVLHGKPES